MMVIQFSLQLIKIKSISFLCSNSMDYLILLFLSPTKISSMSFQPFNACVIDTILAHRQKPDGRYEFLIRRKQFIPSWQPLENLVSALDLIETYLEKQKPIIEENWHKTKFNQQNFGFVKNEKMDMEIQDQETRTSRFQIAVQRKTNQSCKKESYVLEYEQFFPCSQTNPKDRYQHKITSVKKQDKSKCFKEKIPWKDLKRAIEIEYDEEKKTWMVEVEFFGDQNRKIWIQRDILRLVNPFILLDLYGRIERKQLEQKSKKNSISVKKLSSISSNIRIREKKRYPVIIQIE